MNTKFILSHATARNRAQAFITAAPDGWVVTVSEPVRELPANARMHAMLADIARQCTHAGETKPGELFDAEDWKRICVYAFAKYMRLLGEPLAGDSRACPALDGEGVVTLGLQTRKFSKREMANFTEFLFAFGADRGVVWSDPKTTQQEKPEGWR